MEPSKVFTYGQPVGRTVYTIGTLTAMGAVIDLKTPDEMRKIIPAEIAKWTRVAVEAGMPRADK